MCQKAGAKIKVMVDAHPPSGVLGNILEQTNIEFLLDVLKKLNTEKLFEIQIQQYNHQEIRRLNRKQFGKNMNETHCFRGYPIFGSIKQFYDTEDEYILHLDSDMLFYEKDGFSWIKEAISVLKENPDIICVLPCGGPPTEDGSLHQGTTEYIQDKDRSLYLFKNFTSRHYLIHRKRFLDFLPIKTLWLSWREPLKSKIFGKGKLLCWETMVEKALEDSNFWRADLMMEEAWSLHSINRTEEFYLKLPSIIERLERGDYPAKQAGHFDLLYNLWN